MTILERLSAIGRTGWPDLAYGFRAGHPDRQAIIDRAVIVVTEGSEDPDVLELAGGEALTDSDFAACLDRLAQAVPDLELPPDVLWQYLQLQALQGAPISDQEKTDRLQVLYADFGYPEDMAGFCIYAQSSPGPMETLDMVLENLAKKFQQKPRMLLRNERTLDKAMPGKPASLSLDTLDLLQRVLGVKLPKPYRDFMIARNGAKPASCVFDLTDPETGRVSQSQLHHIFAVNSANGYDDLWTVHQRLAPLLGDAFLCIGDDPGGNLLCLAIKGRHFGQVMYVDHEVVQKMGSAADPLPQGVYPVSDSFDAFLAALKDG